MESLPIVIFKTIWFLKINDSSDVFIRILEIYMKKNSSDSAKYERISLMKASVNKQLSKLSRNLERGLSRRYIKRKLKFETELVQEMLTGLEETIQNKMNTISS